MDVTIVAREEREGISRQDDQGLQKMNQIRTMIALPRRS